LSSQIHSITPVYQAQRGFLFFFGGGLRTLCHLRIKSAPFLMDLKFKSALLIFVFFLNHIKKVVVGFVEMWESRRLFQVIVGSVGKS